MNRAFGRLALGMIALMLVLGACGGSEEKSPTVPAEPTAVEESTVQFTTVSSATDGICAIAIPDDWVDDGTGRGETALGDRWTIFGGGAATDAAWTSAKDLLKSQVGSGEGDEVVDSGDVITVKLANGRGYYVRERIGDRYCEFSVRSSRDATAEDLALWSAVGGSLAIPVP